MVVDIVLYVIYSIVAKIIIKILSQKFLISMMVVVD